MKSLWLWMTILSSAFPIILASPEKWFRRSTFLDADHRFRMEWEIEGNEEILFRLEVQTHGFVALAFSKDGTMVDSDVVVGWVSEGMVHLQDRHAEGYRMPELDKRQDYQLISGMENATHTTIVFKRKWDTYDYQDFRFEYDNTIRVMHAYSHEDPDDDINFPFLNTVRGGWKSLLLLQPDFPSVEEDEYWDLLINNITVSPEWDTLYWCKLFVGPLLDTKHQIIKMEPLIMGGHQGHVHHMFLSDCPSATPGEYDRFVGSDGYGCFAPNAPRFVTECNEYLVSQWGIGGEGYTAPDHIGFPLEPTPIKYYMLQVHFDNSNRETGLPGRSGLRFHHTPKLRQFDAGMLMLGLEPGTPNVMAPPGVQDFVVAGQINPDCTGPVTPPKGINLISASLHTHTIGRRLNVRHFRHNVELPSVVDDKNYDPNFQQYHQFQEERVILPWDHLTIECTFDSTSRNQTTLGGFSTREEMCGAFFVYYPKVEGLYGSFSIPQKKITTKLLGSQELITLTAGEPDYSQTYVDYMRTYNWNKTAIRRFEKKVRFSEQQTICRRPNARIESTISYPDVMKE